jgi:hypothetical protein
VKFISIGMVVMIGAGDCHVAERDHPRRLSARRQLAVYGSGLQRRGILLLGTVYRAGNGAGFADKPEKLPKAIMVGMALTFTLLALVPLSVISLNGLDNISDVATISWGRALGEWAFFSANLFALCAMLTSTGDWAAAS